MSGVPPGVSLRSGIPLTTDQMPAEVVLESESTAVVANGSITAAKLASDAVTTVKVLDANVTLAKLANLAVDTVICRKTAGTGVPETTALTSFGRSLIAKSAAVAITGDYSDGTVLASVVAALVSLGLCTDGTTP